MDEVEDSQTLFDAEMHAGKTLFFVCVSSILSNTLTLLLWGPFINYQITNACLLVNVKS